MIQCYKWSDIFLIIYTDKSESNNINNSIWWQETSADELVRPNTSRKYLGMYSGVNLPYNLEHSLIIGCSGQATRNSAFCLVFLAESARYRPYWQVICTKWLIMSTHDNTDLTSYHYMWRSHYYWPLQQAWALPAQQINDMVSCLWQAHTKRQGRWPTVSHPFWGEGSRQICSMYVQTWFSYFCQISQYYSAYHQASAFLHLPNPRGRWWYPSTGQELAARLLQASSWAPGKKSQTVGLGTPWHLW